MTPTSADIFTGQGARGRISLQVAAAGGVSRRTRVHQEGALRVRFPGAEGRQLEAVLVNMAGGVAGGDSAALDVAVGTGAALTVTTAAAEKVYRSGGPGAAMSVELKVGKGASLAWMPRELILFDRSRLSRTIDIELAEDAHLLLAEAVVFGRTDAGAAGDDAVFSDRWRVRRDGRLLYAEDLRLDGAIARTLAGDAPGVAIATILMAPADDTFVAALHGVRDQLCGEVTASTGNGLTLARFCAADGDSLRHDLVTALTIALAGPAPRSQLN